MLRVALPPRQKTAEFGMTISRNDRLTEKLQAWRKRYVNQCGMARRADLNSPCPDQSRMNPPPRENFHRRQNCPPCRGIALKNQATRFLHSALGTGQSYLQMKSSRSWDQCGTQRSSR